MISIKGDYYDGKTSRKISTSLEIYDNGEVKLSHQDNRDVVALSTLRVSSRVGNTPRSIGFPDGGKFETGNNDAVDKALARFRRQSWEHILHLLESRKAYVFTALIAVIVFSWAMLQHGIPALAKTAAFALPAETNNAISQGSLEILDKGFFSPSEIEQDTKVRINRYFVEMAAKQSQDFDYRLLFRKGNGIGANAFALPSGTVVLTDEMVELVKHDDELVAVLAHEIGHVVHRHGLRRVIQDSVFAMLVVLITGDVSSTSSLIIALPTVLVEAQYSQGFEREADSFSLAYLQSNDIDLVHFKSLMLRLQEDHEDDEGVLGYLSSHPPTAERIKMFEDLKEQAKTK